MPGSILTSDEINARIVSSFGYSPFASSPYADRLAGDMTNFAGAWGPQAARAGASLFGVDPLSLGITAASSTFGMTGSMLAGGLVGMGAAGLSGTLGTLGNFAFQQGMVGAQQQQQLNASLRQNFFQMGPRGQGFGRDQQTQIGGMLREMTLQMGPGGELNSMRELTGATSQMAQLGLARGVRDVQDFSRRFKEMVAAATSIARDLGTTLEGGIHAMKGMQGMGIFGAANQMQFSAAARQAGLAGGMGMPEVMQAAAMGSQISRAVGGRGSQGAMAGLRVAGMISSAVASGTLAESQIYNATGYGGAEGRAALVQQQLGADASFLRTNRGRRFMAAYIQKNGAIDDAALEGDEGGMTVEETRARDGQSLARVGRANFLRYEGRARGAMLEKFGGTIQARAMQGWAAGRGIDLFNMDDKESLWAQRQFGMGEDQLEVQLTMLRNLPQLRARQDDVRMNDDMLRNRADRLKRNGLEGMGSRIELAKRRITDGFQEVGAHLYQELAAQMDRLMEQTVGGYEAAATSYMDELHAKVGSREGQAAMGKQLKAVFSPMSGVGGAPMRSNTEQLGRLMDNGGLTGAFMRFSEGKGTTLETLRKSGFSLDGMQDNPDAAMGYLGQVSRGYRSFQAGDGVDSEFVKASAGQGQVIKDFYASTKARGAELPSALAAYLTQRASSVSGEQATQLTRMRDIAARGGDLAGLGGFSSTMAQVTGDRDLVGNVTYGQAGDILGRVDTGGFKSLRERSDAYGQAIAGGRSLKHDTIGDIALTAGRTLAATAFGAIAGGIAGGIPGAVVGGLGAMGYLGVSEWMGYRDRASSEAEARGAMETYESESFRRSNMGAFSSDASVREASRQELKDASADIAKRSRLTDEGSNEYKSFFGKYNTMQGALAGSVAAEFMQNNPNASDDELRKALGAAGVDARMYAEDPTSKKSLRERMRAYSEGYGQHAAGERRDVILGMSERLSSHAKAQEAGLVGGGFLTNTGNGRTELSENARKFIAGGSGSDSVGVALARKVSGSYMDQLAPANETDEARAIRLSRASTVDSDVRSQMLGMSTADLTDFVRAQAGIGSSDLDLSRYGSMLRSTHRQVETTYGASVRKAGGDKRSGALNALTASLGIGLDEDSTKDVKDMLAKGDYASAAQLVTSASGSSTLAGLSSAQRKTLEQTLQAGATGNTSDFGTKMTELLTSLGEQLRKEKEDTDPKVRLQKEANKTLTDIASHLKAMGQHDGALPPDQVPGKPGLNQRGTAHV